MPRSSTPNAVVFWPVVVVIVIADIITKMIALNTLAPYAPQRVLGDALRLTLVRNEGAAFGLYLGPYSRYIFMVLTVGALIILWRLYQSTREGDLPRTLAVALVCAGAIGNLIDRIRWQAGVVDFIDIGFRDLRWPTFNVADMAVSTGAFLLAWVLWGDDRAERARSAEAASVAPAGSRDAP
ncbi:MAG TPA: signal peptidase II [Gemmatimonadaceae bacterium]|jgi:signal peptidase II|nr:signal peptidase II [Gemmatimonadaceae bacterium]